MYSKLGTSELQQTCNCFFDQHAFTVSSVIRGMLRKW